MFMITISSSLLLLHHVHYHQALSLLCSLSSLSLVTLFLLFSITPNTSVRTGSPYSSNGMRSLNPQPVSNNQSRAINQHFNCSKTFNSTTRKVRNDIKGHGPPDYRQGKQFLCSTDNSSKDEVTPQRLPQTSCSCTLFSHFAFAFFPRHFYSTRREPSSGLDSGFFVFGCVEG